MLSNTGRVCPVAMTYLGVLLLLCLMKHLAVVMGGKSHNQGCAQHIDKAEYRKYEQPECAEKLAL